MSRRRPPDVLVAGRHGHQGAAQPVEPGNLAFDVLPAAGSLSFGHRHRPVRRRRSPT